MKNGKSLLKAFVLLLLTSSLLLLSSCKNKIVFQPFPYTYVFSFDMLPQGSTAFADSALLSGAEIQAAILDQLDGEFTLEDVTENNVESLHYVLVNTDQTHAIMNGDFKISYDGSPFADLVDLENVVLGEILSVPQSVPLTEENIQIIQQAVDEILAGNAQSNITVTGAGSTSHLVNRFQIEIRLTVTHVIQQEIELFDPF